MYSPTYCPGGRPCKQKLTSHLEREPWSAHSGGQTEQLLRQRGEVCLYPAQPASQPRPHLLGGDISAWENVPAGSPRGLGGWQPFPCSRNESAS